MAKFTQDRMFEMLGDIVKPGKKKHAKTFRNNGDINDGIITKDDIYNANVTMMKSRLAYANEFGNPAAKRMINIPDNPYEFDNGDTGTHYMASYDNYAVPQIQDENGVLQLGDYGPESNEAIRFDSDEDANYFAEHYKDVSPGFINQKQYGGESGCPMFYKRDPISGECIPFTETEKSEYGTQYMKDWVQSPMYNEMLNASVAKDITIGDKDRVLNDEEKVLLDKYVNKYSKNITDLRLKATNPKVSILESDNDNLPLGEAYPYQLKDSIYFDDPSTLKLMNYQFADYDNPKNIDKNLQAEVNYYTKNYPGEHAYVYPHEVSHLQDMGGSLIPQSDITMMEDYAFTPEIQAVYQNMLKEINDISSKEPFDEQAKKLYLDEQDIIYKKYYPQFHKRYNQDKELYEKDFNKYKVQNVPKQLTDIWKTLDNTLPYDEFIKKYKRFGDPVNKHKYISNVSETRARLNAIRMYGQASGIYNPFEEKLSPEKYKELQNLFYQQNPNDIDSNQLRQLREVYTDEEIFNLLNSISKNEPQQIDELKTPQARQGGALDKFVGGGPTDCKQGEYWNGTKCVPTYGINPSFSNNALTNNVNGINTKIAETKRKGMIYQSTLDELNALNTQKEILRADEAKRKALEAQERQRQQQLRTVGSDNTRVDNSIIKNSSVNFQLPYERAETITKAQKDAARQIVTSGDFGNYFPEQMNYYLSKENSHRQGGPLTLEELALQQIRTNPDFFQSLEEKKYQDFQKREQKTYDNMPWYMKGINTVNALASDPLTTLERGLLEWERPLAFQGLQSTDPSIVGDDARFYDRALNRDENFLNNTLNYINPFRAASSAGQNLQQEDYGDAVVDFATILPMLKGAKLGVKGLNAAMRVSPATLLKGAGSNVLANASPLVQATANKATVGNLLTLYGGYEAGAHNFPNAFDAYGKGDWKTGNKELFTGIAMGTPLALEMGAGKAVAKGVQGAKGLYNDVATGNSFIPYAWKNPAAALDAESSTAMFDKIIQSDNFTNAEKALIKEYQYSSTPFVSAGAKQDQFNALIQKATLEFPNDAVITRAFAGAGDFDSAIGTAGDFKSFSLQGRPSAFSAGTSAKGKYYYANQDRIVLSGKNLKKLEGNFVKNNYEALPEGYYGDVAAEDLAVNDFSKQLSKNIASGSREIQPFDSVGSSYYGTSRLSESEIAAQADAVYAAKAKHYSNLPDHYYQNPDGKVFLENGSAVTSEEAVQMAADHNLGIKKEIDLFTNPARKEEALQSIIKQSQEKAFSANPGPVDELELMGSGFDLKTVGKFKNKHGGTDYVVQPRNIKTQSNNTTTLEASSSSKRIPYNAEKNQNTAIIIEQLRNDRYLKINSPEGKIRIEELIANNPHMKNMTYEDVKNGFANMANENAMQTLMEEEFALLNQRIKNLELNPNANQSQIQRLKTQASKLEGDILFGEEAIEAKTLNAHMMRATTKVTNDSDAIVLTRPNAKGARKDAMPSDIYSILASPELTVEDLSRIVPHEFGHYFQQGAKTNLDKMLSNISLKTNSSSLNSNLFSNEEGISNFYNKLMGKFDPFKSMSKYWRRGGNGQEKTAFMEEVRADMLQRGMIEDLYQTITPELLQEHYVKYMGEVGNKYPLRIYEIMNNNSGNFNIMSEVLNKMPAIVPIGVGGAGMMMMQNNEENSVPKQKRGGNVKTLSKFIKK